MKKKSKTQGKGEQNLITHFVYFKHRSMPWYIQQRIDFKCTYYHKVVCLSVSVGLLGLVPVIQGNCCHGIDFECMYYYKHL